MNLREACEVVASITALRQEANLPGIDAVRVPRDVFDALKAEAGVTSDGKIGSIMGIPLLVAETGRALVIVSLKDDTVPS